MPIPRPSCPVSPHATPLPAAVPRLSAAVPRVPTAVPRLPAAASFRAPATAPLRAPAARPPRTRPLGLAVRGQFDADQLRAVCLSTLAQTLADQRQPARVPTLGVPPPAAVALPGAAAAERRVRARRCIAKVRLANLMEAPRVGERIPITDLHHCRRAIAALLQAPREVAPLEGCWRVVPGSQPALFMPLTVHMLTYTVARRDDACAHRTDVARAYLRAGAFCEVTPFSLVGAAGHGEVTLQGNWHRLPLGPTRGLVMVPVAVSLRLQEGVAPGPEHRVVLDGQRVLTAPYLRVRYLDDDVLILSPTEDSPAWLCEAWLRAD